MKLIGMLSSQAQAYENLYSRCTILARASGQADAA